MKNAQHVNFLEGNMVPKYIKYLIYDLLEYKDLLKLFFTCKEGSKYFKDSQYWEHRIKIKLGYLPEIKDCFHKWYKKNLMNVCNVNKEGCETIIQYLPDNYECLDGNERWKYIAKCGKWRSNKDKCDSSILKSVKYYVGTLHFVAADLLLIIDKNDNLCLYWDKYHENLQFNKIIWRNVSFACIDISSRIYYISQKKLYNFNIYNRQILVHYLHLKMVYSNYIYSTDYQNNRKNYLLVKKFICVNKCHKCACIDINDNLILFDTSGNSKLQIIAKNVKDAKYFNTEKDEIYMYIDMEHNLYKVNLKTSEIKFVFSNVQNMHITIKAGICSYFKKEYVLTRDGNLHMRKFSEKEFTIISRKTRNILNDCSIYDLFFTILH